MQHTQRIQEPLAVAELVAHTVKRNDFAFQIEIVQLLPDGFPVLLNFTKIPGGDA
ncbi:Uncharacterised protein [Acinetobacter baumannii]|nr:Uncharacterised protein [Acinetobacter baumannii]